MYSHGLAMKALDITKDCFSVLMMMMMLVWIQERQPASEKFYFNN